VVSLVVRAADLLSAKHLDQPTISCALYFLDATGGEKTLISRVSQKAIQGKFERLLLPVFTDQYSLPSTSQPLVLTVEHQPGWDILNTPLLASTIVLSTAGLILLLFNTRKRLTTERERAEAYRLLENERAQLDQTIQERTSELSALAEKLFKVQEQERRTLARELHDEIGQTLTAIKTEAVLIKERCGARSPEIGESADAIQTQSDSVYDITHNIMRRLRPRALDDLGLIPSLDSCIAAARLEEQGAKLHIRYDGELDRLGEPANITLYRILQEALTNVGKHAGAKNVWIEVERLTAPIPIGPSGASAAGAVQLVVRDDGRGMDPAHTITGLGLVGARERVQALRGNFQLQTAPGEGLTLSVTIPVEKAADDHE
jgi:glucose-6-phosphate-specific signal transduction histidine kinase